MGGRQASAAAREALRAKFPFEYVGGGYFRRKGVPKGQTAEMLHGEQVVDALIDVFLTSGSETEA